MPSLEGLLPAVSADTGFKTWQVSEDSAEDKGLSRQMSINLDNNTK